MLIVDDLPLLPGGRGLSPLKRFFVDLRPYSIRRQQQMDKDNIILRERLQGAPGQIYRERFARCNTCAFKLIVDQLDLIVKVDCS